MSNLSKILIGIRDSKLSQAQTDYFISEFYAQKDFKNLFSLETKKITTSGDIHKSHRLDRLGGKGLFVKEIEEQILSEDIDLGVHSLKDLPAVETNQELEIACFLKRYDAHDALISNSKKSIIDLPPGSIIGTSSIRRRSQVLSLRGDLKIKLLRGNVDTRIKKLKNGEYDAIILSQAGLQRLKLEELITEVLDYKNFLPAACQGAVGIQAKRKKKYKEKLVSLNHNKTEMECLSEREILKCINANCNSPISVYAEIQNNEIKISCELFDHDGKNLYSQTIRGNKEQAIDLGQSIGKEILLNVGKEKINQLDKLENDFDYTPTT